MTMFKRGSSDPYVSKIQRALNELIKAGLKTDGGFGALTEGKLKEWQAQQGLPVDGIFGGHTANILGQYIDSRFLKEQDFKDAAEKINAEVNAIKAVQMVESRGQGFLTDGRTIILYERHIFKRQLDAAMAADPELLQRIRTNLDVPAGVVGVALQQKYPDIYNQQTGGYIGGMAEYERLARACAIHKESGYRSASWGLFQIMGFHHKLLGFDSAQAMAANYEQSERNQLLSFCDFILADRNLTRAIRNKDFTSFARAYNGPAFATNRYDEKMAQAYQRLNAT